MILHRLKHVPKVIAGEVAGVSVAVVDRSEVATVVTATPAELLTEDECIEFAGALLEAASVIRQSRERG